MEMATGWDKFYSSLLCSLLGPVPFLRESKGGNGVSGGHCLMEFSVISQTEEARGGGAFPFSILFVFLSKITEILDNILRCKLLHSLPLSCEC